MKFVNEELRNLKSEPIKTSIEETEVATVKSVSIFCLTENEREETSGEEKFRRYQIAVRLSKAEGLLELSAEEISLIKKQAGRFLTTEALGALYVALDHPVAEEKAE